MTENRSDDVLGDGADEDPRNDPRWERYLEYCASVKAGGGQCPSFRDWIIASEEGY